MPCGTTLCDILFCDILHSALKIRIFQIWQIQIQIFCISVPWLISVLPAVENMWFSVPCSLGRFTAESCVCRRESRSFSRSLCTSAESDTSAQNGCRVLASRWIQRGQLWSLWGWVHPAVRRGDRRLACPSPGQCLPRVTCEKSRLSSSSCCLHSCRQATSADRTRAI